MAGSLAWTEYTSAGFSSPQGICSDGTDLWMVDNLAGLFKITTGGTIASINSSIPGLGIAFGPDGNIYTTSTAASTNSVWKTTPGGVTTQITLTGNSGTTEVGAICSDGTNLWVLNSAFGNTGIWKLTTGGTSTWYPISAAGLLVGCVYGSDGRIWIADAATTNVWAIDSSGIVTSYSATGGASICSDGTNLWIVDNGSNTGLWQITTAGVATEYLTGLSGLGTVVFNPGGYLWSASESSTGTAPGIMQSDTSGTIATFSMPNGTFQVQYPNAMCYGPDGNLWVCDNGTPAVWKGVFTAPAPASTQNIIQTGWFG